MNEPTAKSPPENLTRIPFDSFVLQGVVNELKAFIGGKVQTLRQPSEFEVCIGIYAGGREGMLLLSCHPEFSRAHFISKRPPNQEKPPVFVMTLRSRMEGGRLVYADQIAGDRVLELRFESDAGDYRLIAELMGKHSNLIFLDSENRVLTAMKWVSKSKSVRPIQPSCIYHLPPVLSTEPGLKKSPFLLRLEKKVSSDSLGRLHAVISPGFGAYPVSVAALGYAEFPRETLSIALENHFAVSIPKAAADSLRSSLLSQLNRTLLSKEVVLSDLQQAEEAGGKATTWQRYGELILAHAGSISNGADKLQAWDYDGTEIQINLQPDLSFKDNANRYFEKAKKAKGRIGIVQDQLIRISREREEIVQLIRRVQEEERLEALHELEDLASKKRWIHVQVVQPQHKEDRPYQGHRIRELQGPGGYMILYGENAESNDYLTLRVAKPNDYWLHVRGATSAHVVVVTRNQPERVQPETIRYAAKVAVLNSTSKHSQYVAVDYTLKKYVRRPKGGAKGSALYTHEKTLHVDMG